MARIAGVNIPTKKRVEIALTYIHGIGTTSARSICAKAGIAEDLTCAGKIFDRNRFAPLRCVDNRAFKHRILMQQGRNGVLVA